MGRRARRADWWYRQLLRCLPFDFQREFGAEMHDVFRQQHHEASRDGRRATMRLWLETARGFLTTAPGEHLRMFRQDALYAFRMMRRAPVFTAAAVLALALGIGANTAIFTLLNELFLNPLPVHEPSRLVSLHMVDRQNPGFTPISTYNFRDLRDEAEGFDDMAAVTFTPLRLTGSGEPQELFGQVVTGNYFDLLGVRPRLGRAFRPEDDVTPGAHPVTVLSHATWARHFGGDPGIIGRDIRLNGHPFTVIGVAPAEFRGTFALFAPDLFVPLTMYETLTPGTEWYESRAWRWLNVIARLEPGVSIDQARASTTLVAERLEREYPQTNRGRGVAVLPLLDTLIDPDQHGTYVRAGLLLAALVAMVLLIACANLANLLLARAVGRSREVALRLALGAGRGRIVRQLLTESLLLATVGGSAGLLLAVWVNRLLYAARPPQFQQTAVALEIDLNVLAFTAVLTMLTSVIFGLVPALQISRPDVNATLKQGGRGAADAGRSRLRSGLIVGEVALSLFALVIAGLFVRSLWQVRQVAPGFATERLAAVDFNLSGSAQTVESAIRFYERTLQELQGRAGIDAATITDRMPLTPGAAYTINVEGRLPPEGALGFQTEIAQVMPGYFDVVGIPLRRGRDFADTDGAGSPIVAVINETMARTFWPDQDPIGRRLVSIVTGPIEVIGVVGDSKYLTLGELPQPFFYLSLRQQRALGFGVRTLVVRSHADPASVVPTVRAAMREIDPDLPLTNVRTLEALLTRATWAQRMIAGLVAAFGALAIVLAAIGLYGVMAYNVSQRASEIGLRMALGASRRDILGMVVGGGMRLTAAGAILGLVGALAASQAIGALLYQVQPTDPVTFVSMPLVLAMVALAACYFPARRAARVDPLVTLHGE